MNDCCFCTPIEICDLCILNEPKCNCFYDENEMRVYCNACIYDDEEGSQ